MSLEQALAENTATMKTLITVLQSVGHVATAPVETAGKGRKKAEAVADASAPADVSNALDAAGNPIGTRYFDVAAHNTVFAVKPGDVEPQVSGAVAISDTQFVAKKAEYAGKIKAAGTQSAEPAAPAPAAPATTAAPEPSAQAQAATASAVADKSFPDVVNKVKELHGLQGNDGVLKLLTQYGVSRVPDLNGKASNNDLIAAAEKLIDDAKSAAALGI